MIDQHIIQTRQQHCQDCYKCVRHCPVKAIRIEDGSASIISELCVGCGLCVKVCPNQAKQVRDDLPHVQQLLASDRPVYVSLAPSFVAAFQQYNSAQVIGSIRQLGFAGVSETALGAQQVSAHVSQILNGERPELSRPLMISSACPTIVAWIHKHRPELAEAVSPLLSPLLAHARLLKQQYGEQIAVVFIGPCISKKYEAQLHPELVDACLSFTDLAGWWQQAGIDPGQCQSTDADRFVPERAEEGALYPIDGGMVAGIKADCKVFDDQCMAFSGLERMDGALRGVERLSPDRPMFFELLACEGGCVNGPQSGCDAATVCGRHRVVQYANVDEPKIGRPIRVDAVDRVPYPTVVKPTFTQTQIREAMRSVGKRTSEDELNCGGCGYDSCRQFAAALLDDKAEREMCVTYMRQLACKKANLLLQTIPLPVAIIDAQLKIAECNQQLNLLLADTDATTDSAVPVSLEGANFAKLVPFANLIRGMLQSDEKLLEKDVHFRDHILHLTVFTIEKHATVGVVFQDITQPAVKKDQIVRRAEEVIKKHMATVQQIAYLLGENAAESEIVLNSIIDAFSTGDADGGY